MHTTLLIISALATVLLAYFAGITAIIYFFPKKLYPVVFVADDLSGYGIRKPTLLRSIVIHTGFIASAVLDLVTYIYCKVTCKAVPTQSLLYRRAERSTWVTDPAEVDNKDMTREQMSNYLMERASSIGMAIDAHGWRRVFIRYTIELPTQESRQPMVIRASNGKEFPVPAMRLTKFVLY